MCERCEELKSTMNREGVRKLDDDEVRDIRTRMLTDENLGPFGGRYDPVDWQAPMTRDQRRHKTKTALDAMLTSVLDISTMMRENLGVNDGAVNIICGFVGRTSPKGANRPAIRFNDGQYRVLITFGRFRLAVTRTDVTRHLECYDVALQTVARVLGPATMDTGRLMHNSTAKKVAESELADALAQTTFPTGGPNPFDRPHNPGKPTPPVS